MPDYETIPLPPPVRGLDKKTEAVFLNPKFSPNLKNVHVTPTKLFKRLGDTLLGNNLPLDGTGMELIEFIDGIGTRHLIAITTTTAYVYDADSDRWRILNPSTVLEDCEDDWVNDNVNTCAAQATTFKIGSKAILVSITSDVASGTLLCHEGISSTDITSEGFFGCWLRLNKQLSVGSLEFVLSETAAGSDPKTGVDGTNYITLTNDLILYADTWYFLQIPLTGSDVPTNMNAVINIALYAKHATELDGNVTETKIYLDDLRSFTAFTGSVTDRWSHVVINDSTESWQAATALMISNGIGSNDQVFVWDGTSATGFASFDLSDLSGFASVKEIEHHFDHLCFYNYNTGTQKTRFLAASDVGDVDDFSAGTSLEKLLSDTKGAIVRAKKFGSNLFLYNDLSITTQRYVGTPKIFSHKTYVTETGLFAPKALYDTALMHYFIGTDQKIYGYAGGAQLTPVAYVIEEALFKSLNLVNKNNIVMGYDVARHKLYVCYPDRDGDFNDTYAQSYYCLNIKDNPPTWEWGRFAHDIRDFSVFSNQTSYTCDGAFFAGVTCDEDSDKSNLRCDLAYAQAGFSMAVVIDSSGNVYKLDQTTGTDNGTNIEMIIETGDFTVLKGNQKTSFRASEYGFNANCADSPSGLGTVNVYYSTDQGVTWTEFEDSPVTLETVFTEHLLEFDISTTQVRFKYVQDSATDFQLRGHSIKLKKGMERQ